MACPSGCLNGSGQLKSLNKDLKTKEFIDNLETHYKIDKEPILFENFLNKTNEFLSNII
jgi:iron only hydrogenase large subunit-like protein